MSFFSKNKNKVTNTLNSNLSPYQKVPTAEEGNQVNQAIATSTVSSTEEETKSCCNKKVLCIFITIIVIIAVFILFGPPGPGNESDISCEIDQDMLIPTINTTKDGPQPAALRGNVACVDSDAYALRDLNEYPTLYGATITRNIYGPMEAGFTSRVPGMSCLGRSQSVSRGVDTNTAALAVVYLCHKNGHDDEEIMALDTCGGHAIPYHYHERFNCLYTTDDQTGHSTRVGTAADGRGIYGPYIGEEEDGGDVVGILPNDTDTCGGRWGVTPDSDGQIVYYYPIKAYPPFTLGCYGPIDSVQQCRDLYPDTCGPEKAVVETITTMYGTGQYTLDCPCFDENHSNVLGNDQGRPAFLPPL
eukprot:CAMPEP_0202457364 /NCGR_PEP_ID=MMETSP1360-20130828/14408_1 /ASSEMBLY_ACC=CAM_ASM_000848 /TAXON_ID=515479 /ORGANISM="Licmophora paradoxa, Strain CCMP2313" /LENGTH=358 /DNA_ID=CAMNT_0049077433 /DNA_START=62 /DNA_END=1138 /DNA_ORIENTATION=+